jgi:hypothetical protein
MIFILKKFLSDYSGYSGNERSDDQSEYYNSTTFLHIHEHDPRQLSSGYTQSHNPLYYTSVVDLKPFDHAELARISRQHQRNQSPMGKQLPVIKRKVKFGNENRKFLINKSIRLYEPINEAAMMSKIGQLRHKLASAKPEIQKVSRLSLAKSVNDQDQANYEKFIEPFKENSRSNTNRENKPKCFDDTLEDEQIKNTNFETLNNPIQTSTDQMDTITGENRNQAPYNTSRGNTQVPNFEETFHDFNSLKPPPTAASGMSKQERILTARKTPRHFVPIFHEPNFQLSQAKVQHLVRQSTRNRFSNIYKTDDNEEEPENTNNSKSILSKAAFNSLENINHFTNSAPTNNNNNNINKVSRPETGDTTTTTTTISINKSLNKYNLRTATNLSVKSLPNKYSISAPPQYTNSEHITKTIRPETASHNKKLHPALKHKKEKESQCIENIINDVPSSIKIMSKKGKATNIEKLIALKLSEYYSNKRLIY